ncbi:MAG: tyrosine-type recombinase/integrase, partial [Candidatus Limnocylindria bacterium]
MDLTPDELELLGRLRDDPAKLVAATKALQGPRKRKPNQRAKGEGSVFKVTSGGHTYWRGQIEAGHYPSGKRRYATITRKTKKAVVDAMPELRRRVGAGIVGPDQTVAQLAEEWLDVRADKVNPKTVAEYRRRLELWVLPHVGQIPLRKLSTRHVRDMMRTLADEGARTRGKGKGLSPRTANLAKVALSSMLKWAVGEKRIEQNVCDFVEGSKLGAKLDDSLAPEEIERVLTVARGDRNYALLYLSATLGLRQSEALNLRWSDVDLDGGKHGELRVDQSKTRAGQRSLPLVASCRETLREHRTRQVAERMAAEQWDDNDLVFPDRDGGRMTARAVLGWWHRQLAKAGLPERRWHALRHSAAQRMLAAGVPLDLVSITL